MGFSNVIDSIVTRWTAQSLDDTVTGGLHLDDAPKGTSLPYAVLTDLGESTPVRAASSTAATASHYRSRQVQVRTHNNTGPAALAVLADAVHAALEYAPLNLTGATLLYCRLNSDILTKDSDHENGWMWVGTYDVLYHIAQALSPA